MVIFSDIHSSFRHVQKGLTAADDYDEGKHGNEI